MAEPADEVARLLAEHNEGRDVLDKLLPLVYDELRRIARSRLRREREGHTLQPTALVHEAYIDLLGQRNVAWESRAHFLALAAIQMRRILVDHARAHNANRRGGGAMRVTLSGLAVEPDADVEMIMLDDALERLAKLDERHAKVVELRHFAGLKINEIAKVLDIAPATVKRDWAAARAWLRRELHAAKSA
jgi:RNA polymerase sigma-70 factor (ECF subfamily)